MEIEDIAKLDLFLRQHSGTQNILDIESLIVTDNDPTSVTKLKDAVHRLNALNKLENNELQDLKETWKNLFEKQVRLSVNRTKEKIQKK